jgi:hypothetical protein
MFRALPFVSILCAASLLGNVWLYRELRVRVPGEARTAVAAPVTVPNPPPDASSLPSLPAVVLPVESKPTFEAMMDKCKKKFEDESRRQFRDPKQREQMKISKIQVLQAQTLGAQTGLQLSDQVFSRILELQAEQDLARQEASIGNAQSLRSFAPDPEIAAEFGEDTAAKWANYMKEGTGRWVVQGVAGLLAEANVPLSDMQRRKLVTVYTNEFETQRGQNDEAGIVPFPDGGPNSVAFKNWLVQQEEKRIASDRRIQDSAAEFLTPAQLSLMHKKSDLDAERSRAVFEAMPKVEAAGRNAREEIPLPMVTC